MTPRISLVALLALAGCSSGASPSPGASPREGDLGDEITPYTGFALPGLRLSRRCIGVPDHVTCSVYGVDEWGRIVDGPELFHRLGTRPALELAVRAHDLLLGRSGRLPLRPGDDHASQPFVSEEEWSVIAEPVIEDGTLVFSTMEGEMSPQAMQLRIELASPRVERTPVIEVWARTTEIGLEPSCEPFAACGCDAGCLRVVAVPLPDGRGTYYRAVDPRRARHLYTRSREGALAALGHEVCDAECPPHAPRYPDCVAAGERCAPVIPY